MDQTCPQCSASLSPNDDRCKGCGYFLETVDGLPRAALQGTSVGDVAIDALIRVTRRAVVYRGEQEPIGRVVTVKLLPAIKEGQSAKQQLVEMQALGKLRHANVVTLYNVGLFEKRFPYMVTEHMLGGSLREIIDRYAPLAPARALGILQQLASALEAVHAQDMLHRNLSPNAILLEQLAGSRQELAKLSDFGQAQLLDDGEELPLSARAAHPEYMAPEQVLGGAFTAASDMYAIGIILYEMLTGQLPYSRTSAPKLWDEIVGGEIQPVANLVPELHSFPQIQALITQLLNRKPEARLKDARSLRLLTTRMRDDIIALGGGNEEEEAFPVLETAARVPAVSREAAAAAAPKMSAKPAPPPAHPVARPRSKPDDGPALPDISREELDALKWRTIVPRQVEVFGGKSYIMLAASAPEGTRMTYGFAGGAQILLIASYDPCNRLVAIAPPENLTEWLAQVAHQAEVDSLSVGLAFDRKFPVSGTNPSTRTSRSALLAARRGKAGELLAARHAAEALNVNSLFQDIDADKGRYSSVLKYSG